MPNALSRDGGCYTQSWRLELAAPEPLAAAHAPPEVRDDPHTPADEKIAKFAA